MKHEMTLRLGRTLAVALSLFLAACGGGGTGQGSGSNGSAVPVPPSVITQPEMVSSEAGASVTLSVKASGSEPLSYQWYRAGVIISGATGNLLSLTSISDLDSGVGYTVKVSNAAGSVTSQAGVLTILPHPISACMELSKPGNYVLQKDIVADAGKLDCLTLRDTEDIHLDCANHIIQANTMPGVALRITNVNRVSVKNCTLKTPMYIEIVNSNEGSLQNNTIMSTKPESVAVTVSIFELNHFLFDNNTVIGAYVESYGSSNTVSNNHFTGVAGATLAGMVVSHRGTNLKITGNTMDGKWNGKIGDWNSTDDGIILIDSSDVVVEDNIISNVFDTGVEWLGLLHNASIRSNQITNTGVSGIGGWYWASLSDSTIAQNHVQRAPQLFYIVRAYGLRAANGDKKHPMAADTSVTFKNNVFDGNTFANPNTLTANSSSTFPVYDRLAYSGASADPTERNPTAADFQISGNVFRNNQFGNELPAPNFGTSFRPGLIIDDGGNKCQVSTWPNYPLKCN